MKSFRIHSFLLFSNLLIFLLAASLILGMASWHAWRETEKEARELAEITLQKNLAIHAYFNQEMKPRLLENQDLPEGYFDPFWMSSTFAVRQIESHFRQRMPEGGYVYKECAIDARDPRNEADPFEAEFIGRLNAEPELEQWSGIRLFEGMPYFVHLSRGETMEKGCLGCHSEPERAPEGLVDHYGPERSFGRQPGEVVSAVSMRIPLGEAFAANYRLFAKLALTLLALVAGLSILQYWITRRFLVDPLNDFCGRVLQIAENRTAGGSVPVGHRVRELREMAMAFNAMSASHCRQHEELEETVNRRTAELVEKNRELDLELQERKRIEESLRLSENLFRTIFEHIGTGLVTFTPEGALRRSNPALCRMFGYSQEELREMTLIDITEPEYRTLAIRENRSFQNGEIPVLDHESRFLTKEGNIFWGHVNAVLIRDDNQTPLYGVALISDITQRKEAELEVRRTQEKFNYMAYHDSLTNLPNRLLIRDRLEHAIAGAQRRGLKVAVLFIDMDRFKNINDTLGHTVGDGLLKVFAERLRSSVRDSDTLGRFGGDEFVILLEHVTSATHVSMVCECILASLKKPLPLNGEEFYISVSIGISLCPDDSQDAEELLKNADGAMYQAKEQGRNGFSFFKPDQNIRTRERLLLENSLHQAVARNQLVLHYQPQFELRSRKMVGMEALLRWQHPEMGLVSPGKFIPLAEETGLIIAFEEWALRTACRQNVQWQKAGHAPIRMAVNISARHFRHGKLGETVKTTLKETGMEPRLLELEITESMVMGNVEEAIMILEELKEIGVQLAIDDFGTGFSSMMYLQRFPIHRLKIDRVFVQDVALKSSDATIAASIIALAKSMAIEVVAEGIESEEQLGFLQAKQCDYGQGYLFARPLPPAEVLFMD